MVTVTRTFDWDTKGKDGWKPSECPDFDAGNGFMVAHDTLEHFNRDEKFESELLAFGTTMWSRMSSHRGEGQQKQINSSGSDLANFVSDQKYQIPDPSPYAKKLLLADNEEALLKKFMDKAVYYSDNNNGDVLDLIFGHKKATSVEKFEVVKGKIMPWIRLGFKMAKRRFKDPDMFLKMFVTVQRSVNNEHDNNESMSGDKLKVTADFTKLTCTLEHSRFRPIVHPILKEI
jgi:hypothetical protein